MYNKLTLEINSLWMKLKTENFASKCLANTLSKSEGKKEMIFLIIVALEKNS